MKSVPSSCLVFAAGLVVFLTGSVASLIPFNASSLSAMVGGIASASLLACAFADYTRKPQLWLDALRQPASRSAMDWAKTESPPPFNACREYPQ